MRFRLTAAALFALTSVLACAKGGETAKDSTKTAATGGGAPGAHSDSVLRIAMIAKTPIWMRASDRPAKRLASTLPPNAKMCRPMTVRVR